MEARGWKWVDVVLVTGDAYVDHPSFGVALIGRWLEHHGFRVAILAQPRHDREDDFRRFGRPRLFFGITSGNLDSIVANYTGNARVRQRDDYSPGGNPYFGLERSRRNRRRPDRATILYANLARAAYPGSVVVLGGIEASLRRFVHYDYQQQGLRGSVLTDAKADLLVYGMGERQVLEIASRLATGRSLDDIPGTCQRFTATGLPAHLRQIGVELPSFEEIRENQGRFLDAELLVEHHARALSGKPLFQRQQSAWVVQHPPAEPLRPEELDRLYALPFTRQPHPLAGRLPAFEMIRDSVTIVRGCSGNCSFCAISRHQGPVVVSRSSGSVLEEVERLARSPGFRGTVTDLGGPTANLYGTRCANPRPCTRRDCLYPKVCPQLTVDGEPFLNLLHEAEQIPGVKHLFVSSGLRMELLLKTPELLRAILLRHTPGMLKIAPEHTDPEVLRLMHKPGPEVLDAFLEFSRALLSKTRPPRFSPYLISAHPGCTLEHMERMARDLKRFRLVARQFQDFTPTPGTLSTAMYVSGLDRERRNPIYVARKQRERAAQRAILEKIRNVPAPTPSGRRATKAGRARGR